MINGWTAADLRTDFKSLLNAAQELGRRENTLTEPAIKALKIMKLHQDVA